MLGENKTKIRGPSDPRYEAYDRLSYGGFGVPRGDDVESMLISMNTHLAATGSFL